MCFHQGWYRMSSPPSLRLPGRAWAWSMLMGLVAGVATLSVLILADDLSNGYAYALRGAVHPAAFYVYETEWRVGVGVGVLSALAAHAMMRRRCHRGKIFLSRRFRTGLWILLWVAVLYGALSLVRFERVDEMPKPTEQAD